MQFGSSVHFVPSYLVCKSIKSNIRLFFSRDFSLSWIFFNCPSILAILSRCCSYLSIAKYIFVLESILSFSSTYAKAISKFSFSSSGLALIYFKNFFTFNSFRSVTSSILIVELRTCRNVRINHQKMKLLLFAFPMNGGDQHATGIDTHHFSRRQICDGDASLSDEFFRLTMSVDTAQNRS